jgi:hypothetical protein
MADLETLKEAVEQRGPFAVWDLMSEEERREAATALWESPDRESRMAIETALAKDLKFRPQSVRRLKAEKVVGRLVRMATEQPEPVLFQYLFHLHMAGRRPLLVELLDGLGLSHEDGVLNLPDDAKAPEAEQIDEVAGKLIESHGQTALIYLATLKVADANFWAGIDSVLERYTTDGKPITEQ